MFPNMSVQDQRSLIFVMFIHRPIFFPSSSSLEKRIHTFVPSARYSDGTSALYQVVESVQMNVPPHHPHMVPSEFPITAACSLGFTSEQLVSSAPNSRERTKSFFIVKVFIIDHASLKKVGIFDGDIKLRLQRSGRQDKFVSEAYAVSLTAPIFFFRSKKR